MKAKESLKWFGILLLVFLLGISCMTMTALASGGIDLGQEGVLNLYFGENGTGFSEVAFSIYRVASVSEDGAYRLTSDFEQYSVSLENLDSSGWRALTQTLDAYVARDGIVPLITRETGQDGRFQLTGLSVGLYLVTGGQYVDGNTVYTPEPMLVSIPGQAIDGEWDYSVEVSCKFDKEDTADSSVSRKVQKVWKDDGNKEKRPENITVQLLKNGNVVDTVVLSQENNWEYTWSDLDGRSKWQIVEANVPNGYTVTTTQESNIFVLTNTYPSKQPSKLPQTGMLWWPAPLLVCVGLLFLITGIILRYKQDDPHEK